MTDYLNQPGVWITPARQGGSPCIIGTRITLDHVENYLWGGEGLAEYCADYELTREQVLCAAWVAADCGLLRRPKCQKAWAAWADEHLEFALRGEWRSVPPPPDKQEAQG